MVKYEITENPYGIDIDDLMCIGKRQNNPKRNFLFISKVLGKHITVKPDVVRSAGYLLASRHYDLDPMPYIQYLHNQTNEITFDKKAVPNQSTLVIGFAETATGLGMSVASAIKGSTYVCTTRENLNTNTVFTFEEQHSHATTHKMYFDNFNFDEIILVDDEITTGRSMLNLITELHKLSSAKSFTILSILDWRTDSYRQMFEEKKKELGVDITVKSIISGKITETNADIYIDEEQMLDKCKIDLFTISNEVWKHDGKMGVNEYEIEKMEKDCEKIAREITRELKLDGMRDGEKLLVMGHGENIYIPSRIASFLPFDVWFKTTTRSPIYCDGRWIKSRKYFYDGNTKYYLYNEEEMEEEFEKIIMIGRGKDD